MNQEYEHLNWPLYPGMVRIRTLADGSCLFHAIANAYFIPYRTGILDGKSISRPQLIRTLRRQLSIRLGEPVDPLNPDGPTHYDLLSRGQLRKFAESVPRYSLENMQKELDSNDPVDNVYNEFLSNQLNKDIYLLNAQTKDVLITGNDDDILYKDRDSIVILYLTGPPGHYELVGLDQGEDIMTIFPPSHPFILAIRHRMNELRGHRTSFSPAPLQVFRS